jgi:hypothetical protein
MLPVFGHIGASVIDTKKSDSTDVSNLNEILGNCCEASARLTGKA